MRIPSYFVCFTSDDDVLARSATLPGDEDMEGLSAILDPSTVTGRVARISLMTTGSAGDAMALAFADNELMTPRSHMLVKRDSPPRSAIEETNKIWHTSTPMISD